MEEELTEIDPRATVVVLRLAKPDLILESHFENVLEPKLRPFGDFKLEPFGGPTEAGKHVYTDVTPLKLKK
jgi:hypothetical protein